MKNLLANWKTTAAGLGMAVTAIVHLVFAAKMGKADENTWTTAILAVIGGIGLIAAGDATKSVTKEEADTTFIKKPDAAPLTDQTPKPPTP